MCKRILFLLLLLTPAFFTKAQTIIEDSTFFTPAAFYNGMGLKNIESNKSLKVYVKSEDKPDDVSRTVDIRWVFATKQEASTYLDKNLELQSENGYRIKKEIVLPNAARVYVYREEGTSVGMYDMMGAENVHWYFIFEIEQVVAKVFTAGNKTSIATAYKIALEAAKHISSKLNLPIKETELSKFNFSLEKGFSEKITKGKLDFFPIPGFETNPVAEPLKKYFDQEFVFPGEKYCVRYFIIKNEEETKGSLDDSINYKNYWRNKAMGSMSVSMNIMMPDMGGFPDSKENVNRNSCKKINNSDFIMEYRFEVGKNSELARGYKYCYMYAMYKQGAPDCYVIYLSDDYKKFTLFRHLNKSSIKFKD